MYVFFTERIGCGEEEEDEEDEEEEEEEEEEKGCCNVLIVVELWTVKLPLQSTLFSRSVIQYCSTTVIPAASPIMLETMVSA